MINKVELGSVNSKNKPQMQYNIAQNKGQMSFTGFGNVVVQKAVKGIQRCAESPMLNVTVPKRKFNFVGGFEALRREGSGLLINCIIPSYVVYGVAKLLQRPVMGMFKKSSLARSWANSDTINQVQAHFNQATGATKEERVFNTLKTMFDNIEGVDGDVSNGGLKKFSDIFANKKEYKNAIKKMTQQILSDNPKKGYATDMYRLKRAEFLKI